MRTVNKGKLCAVPRCGRPASRRGLCDRCDVLARSRRQAELPCRHCGERGANRPRQLCHRCYYTPGVRAAYPASKYAGSRQVRDFNGPDRPAGDRTPHPAGSAAKVAVLEQRALLRQPLWHPGDAADRDTPPGVPAGPSCPICGGGWPCPNDDCLEAVYSGRKRPRREARRQGVVRG